MNKEANIVKLIIEGNTLEQICVSLDTSRKYVQRTARNHNLDLKTDLDVRNNLILDLYKQKISTKEICERLQLGYDCVCTVLRKKGVKLKKHTTPSMDNNIIKQVLLLTEQGLTTFQIGEKLNISSATVRKYLKLNGKESNSVKHKSIFNKPLELTQFQLEVLYGSLLGDMSIDHCINFYRPVIVQGIKQKNYFFHKCDIFSNVIGQWYLTKSFHKKTNKWYEKYQCNFLCHSIYTEIYKLFYPNGKKVVTKEILDKITPIGLAYWFMDDGSKTLSLATNCFSLYECNLIKEWLLNKYNIKSRLYTHNNQTVIFIKPESHLDFEKIIVKYVHPSMYYKLSKLDPNAENWREIP